jgi:hypothetical protein
MILSETWRIMSIQEGAFGHGGLSLRKTLSSFPRAYPLFANPFHVPSFQSFQLFISAMSSSSFVFSPHLTPLSPCMHHEYPLSLTEIAVRTLPSIQFIEWGQEIHVEYMMGVTRMTASI